MTHATQLGLWIVSPVENPGQPLRLICLPYAGGGASVFYRWPRYLSPEIQLCAVQLPGRQARLMEPPYTRLMPFVETLSRVLGPFLTAPYALYGHSLGALICFELARQVRRQGGRNPEHLFASGCRAPRLPDPDPPIHGLPAPEFFTELQRRYGTPQELLGNAELMTLMLPTLRADLEMAETYCYTDEPPLDCPVSAFGGQSDPRVGHNDLEAWREETSGPFDVRMFPGDHFYLSTAQARLVTMIERDLMVHLS